MVLVPTEEDPTLVVGSPTSDGRITAALGLLRYVTRANAAIDPDVPVPPWALSDDGRRRVEIWPRRTECDESRRWSLAGSYSYLRRWRSSSRAENAAASVRRLIPSLANMFET